MMMALGMFVFSLETLAYQEFQRQTEWRHGSTSRIGTNPARQYLGRGDDSITLPGVLLPALAGSQLSLDALRTMADTGKAWPLVEGTGKIYVIRETRLSAKEQIRSLMAAGEVEQAQQLAEQTIAAIEAAVAGVGNAAA